MSAVGGWRFTTTPDCIRHWRWYPLVGAPEVAAVLPECSRAMAVAVGGLAAAQALRPAVAPIAAAPAVAPVAYAVPFGAGGGPLGASTAGAVLIPAAVVPGASGTSPPVSTPTPTSVPEPSSVVLLIGLVGAAILARRGRTVVGRLRPLAAATLRRPGWTPASGPLWPGAGHSKSGADPTLTGRC